MHNFSAASSIKISASLGISSYRQLSAKCIRDFKWNIVIESTNLFKSSFAQPITARVNRFVPQTLMPLTMKY